MAHIYKLNCALHSWINRHWERLFSWQPSVPTRLLICTVIAATGFCLAQFLIVKTGTYFTFVIIFTVVLISLCAGVFLAFLYAVILSMLGDYFFIPPLGGVFEDRRSFEHFIVVCSAALITAIFISSLRSAFQRMKLAKQEAESAAMQMEKILALVSHDVRNPLGAAKMAAQLVLESGRQNEQLHTLLVLILRNLDRADTLIQSLLDVTRIRSGQMIPLNFHYCDLRAQIGDLIEEMALTQTNRLKLVGVDSMWGGWSVDGIRRALENLITNAIKYGENNTPITVTLRCEGEQAVISVHNVGKEIAEEDQGRLFDYFHRAHGAEGSSLKGWGLGLALVRGVAEAHGGAVYVESAKDRGTKFTLRLVSHTVLKTSSYAENENLSKEF